MTQLISSPQGVLTAALLFLALYWLGLAALGAITDWRAHRARDASRARILARIEAARQWPTP